MNTTPPLLHRSRRAALSITFALLALVTLAAEPARKNYNLPAGDATATLKAFSQQSGEQIVFPVESVRGVQTKSVAGELTAREALEQMVAGTDLVVVRDEKTGALAVYPKGAAPSTVRASEVNKAIKLEDYRVLGSRIRQTESEGPSPVSTYDAEYIKSTGAMTLANFLNLLPQNYSGISAGRGSTPNELNPEFGQRTETTTPAFNFVLGASAAGPGQTGVSGAGLRGLGSGSTLVLVDGRRVAQSGAGNRSTDSRQGFVDLNTIPLGMVERIEIVTDGASAIYGADAVAGVINIVLKKNWTGNELSGSYRGAFHGGATERTATLISGFSSGKLRGTVSVDYYAREDLKASQRNVSKNQDHRGLVAGFDVNGNPVAGRDLRINWGYPATVQARTGTLAGMTRPDTGAATNVALTPTGYATMPPLSAFEGRGPVPPNTGVFATGQRRGNTAEFLDLVPEAERYGVAGRFSYEVNERLEFFTNVSYSESKGSFDAQPPVSSASASSGFGNFATIVPAAYNPFGQDVLVGMVHYEFGPITQRTKSEDYKVTLGAAGKFGATWAWDAAVGHNNQKSNSSTRQFNGAAITAALANTDASLRLNPFIDARVAGVTQSAIYERMALYDRFDAKSENTTIDISADGALFPFWGGDVQAAIGAAYEKREADNYIVRNSVAVTSVATVETAAGELDTKAVFAEVSVPFFGRQNARPGFRRLDVQLAGRHEKHSRAGDITVPKVGLSWAPHDDVLLRASLGDGFRAPSVTEYFTTNTTSTTSVLDPRRGGANTTGVVLTRGSNPDVKAELSDTLFYGIVWQPKKLVPGLTLSVDFTKTEQTDVIQVLSAQNIVNNEALFAGRVTRAAPTPADQAANQPGAITAVNQVFISYGSVRNQSIDYHIEYRLPSESFGRWRLTLDASQTTKAERDLRPGQPPIIDEDDTFAPPKWRLNTGLFWSMRPFTVSVFGRYLSGFKSNLAGNLFATGSIPSQWMMDVRGSYEFENGVWRGYGKGLRISGGIGNVFDREPPFSDTVFGYNGALHPDLVLGRTYEVGFTLPF